MIYTIQYYDTYIYIYYNVIYICITYGLIVSTKNSWTGLVSATPNRVGWLGHTSRIMFFIGWIPQIRVWVPQVGQFHTAAKNERCLSTSWTLMVLGHETREIATINHVLEPKDCSPTRWVLRRPSWLPDFNPFSVSQVRPATTARCVVECSCHLPLPKHPTGVRDAPQVIQPRLDCPSPSERLPKRWCDCRCGDAGADLFVTMPTKPACGSGWPGKPRDTDPTAGGGSGGPKPTDTGPVAGGSGGPKPSSPDPAGGGSGGPKPTDTGPVAGGSGGPKPSSPDPAGGGSGGPKPTDTGPVAGGSGPKPTDTGPSPDPAGGGSGGPKPTDTGPVAGGSGPKPTDTGPSPDPAGDGSGGPKPTDTGPVAGGSGGPKPSSPDPAGGGSGGPKPTDTGPVAGGSGGPTPSSPDPAGGGSGGLKPTDTGPVAGGSGGPKPSSPDPAGGGSGGPKPTDTGPVAGGSGPKPTDTGPSPDPAGGGSGGPKPTDTGPVAGGSGGPTPSSPDPAGGPKPTDTGPAAGSGGPAGTPPASPGLDFIQIPDDSKGRLYDEGKSKWRWIRKGTEPWHRETRKEAAKSTQNLCCTWEFVQTHRGYSSISSISQIH